jgi:hypothetical protein
MRARAPLEPAAALVVLLLAGCEGAGEGGLLAALDRATGARAAEAAASEQASGGEPGAAAAGLPLPEGVAPPAPAGDDDEGAGPDAPDIYMALQQGSDGTVSIVFAIDAARDGDPGDDPAIRLTPEAGLCNPQELRRYDFPARAAARPVFSRAETGVGPGELPTFLATAVSTEMMAAGLAREPDDTRPQNLCTYELWRRLTGAGEPRRLAGQ